jgi:hypothetical protein
MTLVGLNQSGPPHSRRGKSAEADQALSSNIPPRDYFSFRIKVKLWLELWNDN